MSTKSLADQIRELGAFRDLAPEAYHPEYYGFANIAHYDENARLQPIVELCAQMAEALENMLEHICDGGGERPCSQMWFQDVAEDALMSARELLKQSDDI